MKDHLQNILKNWGYWSLKGAQWSEQMFFIWGGGIWLALPFYFLLLRVKSVKYFINFSLASFVFKFKKGVCPFAWLLAVVSPSCTPLLILLFKSGAFAAVGRWQQTFHHCWGAQHFIMGHMACSTFALVPSLFSHHLHMGQFSFSSSGMSAIQLTCGGSFTFFYIKKKEFTWWRGHFSLAIEAKFCPLCAIWNIPWLYLAANSSQECNWPTGYFFLSK